MAPVLLCDATDRRGFAWDMGADITEPNHAKAVAKLFVPDEKSTQPYFARAGQANPGMGHTASHQTRQPLESPGRDYDP